MAMIRAKMNGGKKDMKIGVNEEEKLLRKEYLKKDFLPPKILNKKPSRLLFMKNQKKKKKKLWRIILPSTSTRAKVPRKSARGVDPPIILRSNDKDTILSFQKVGHMVANSWRKKVDYIFQRMKEDLHRKAEIREKRKNLQKSKERNGTLEINII